MELALSLIANSPLNSQICSLLTFLEKLKFPKIEQLRSTLMILIANEIREPGVVDIDTPSLELLSLLRKKELFQEALTFASQNNLPTFDIASEFVSNQLSKMASEEIRKKYLFWEKVSWIFESSESNSNKVCEFLIEQCSFVSPDESITVHEIIERKWIKKCSDPSLLQKFQTIALLLESNQSISESTAIPSQEEVDLLIEKALESKQLEYAKQLCNFIFTSLVF